MEYSALVVSESEGTFSAEVKRLTSANVLPEGVLLIKVLHSSVNYKDALSYSGNKGVTRNFPHTPGIDAVGEILESGSSIFKKGEQIIVTGYGLGMNTAGGFGEVIQVPEGWAVPLPSALTAKESMAWGTAGLTAALCVEKLLKHGISKDKPILVSGASGGVGSVAIMLLSKLGFDVHALTSKTDSKAYLKEIGATETHLLSEFIDDSKRPVLKPMYSAAIDVAGGNVLETILKSLDYGGAVACCGLVASPQLNTSVFPFILRDIALLGVDSVELPITRKQEVWGKISTQWGLPHLIKHCKEVNKQELAPVMDSMLKGQISGRYILTH